MERIGILHKQLASLEMDVSDLSWTGPEPTRLTYNRLVENGDEEDPQAEWSGLGSHSTLERWGRVCPPFIFFFIFFDSYLFFGSQDMGIRRLYLDRELKAVDLDPKVLMLDEKVRMISLSLVLFSLAEDFSHSC